MGFKLTAQQPSFYSVVPRPIPDRKFDSPWKCHCYCECNALLDGFGPLPRTYRGKVRLQFPVKVECSREIPTKEFQQKLNSSKGFQQVEALNLEA